MPTLRSDDRRPGLGGRGRRPGPSVLRPRMRADPRHLLGAAVPADRQFATGTDLAGDGSAADGVSHGHRYRRHLHRPGRGRRGRRRPAAHRQGAFDACSARPGGVRRAGRVGGCGRGAVAAGAGHHARHQRRAGATRCPRPLPDHGRLPGRAVHPADRQEGPLRPAVAEAGAVRGAARLHRRARAGGGRRRGAYGADRRRAAAGRGGGRGAARRACRIDRKGCGAGGQPAVLLREPRARAALGRVPEPPLSGPARIGRRRHRADVARVRTRQHHDPGRLPAAAHVRLDPGAGTGPGRAPLRRHLHHHEVQRRTGGCGGGQGAAGAHHAVRPGRRRDRRPLLRRTGRPPRPDHLRHGRHQHRRGHGGGRADLLHHRLRGRLQPAGVGAQHRPAHGRRRRRLDRLDRSGRHAAGRTAERRCVARPGLLRPGR